MTPTLSPPISPAKSPLSALLNAAKRHSRRRFPWVWLLIIGLLILSVRLRFLSMPLERDEGEYAVMGRQILRGIPPYRDAYNMKLPGAYAIYAGFEALFGQTIFGIRCGFLLIDLATTGWIFLLARRLFCARSALWSAAAYALLSQSPALMALAGQPTHLINFFALPGVLLLLRALKTRQKRLFLGAGLCFGFSLLMKQQAVFLLLFPPVLAAWRLRTSPKLVFKAVFWLLFGSVVPYSLLVLTLKSSGDFASFWFWTVDYARAYTGLVSPSEAAAILLRRVIQFQPDAILWLFGTLGYLMAMLKRPRQRLLLALFGMGSWLSVVPGFYFRPHYFITVLPVVALGFGASWHIVSLQIRRQPRLRRFALVPTFAALAALFLTLSNHSGAFWVASPSQYLSWVYPENPFALAPQIASEIAARSAPGDQIAVLGSEPQIYFYAQRQAATGFLYAYPLMERQPFALQMQHQMAREIERNRPEWIVFENVKWAWATEPTSHRFIFEWWQKYRSNLACAAIIEIRGEKNRWIWNPPRGYQPKTTAFISLWKRAK